MTVAVVLNDEKHVHQVLPWAVTFAKAEKTNLLAIVLKRSTSAAKWSEIDCSAPDGTIETVLAEKIKELAVAVAKPASAAKDIPKDQAADNARTSNESAGETTNSADDTNASAPLVQMRRLKAVDTVTALSEELDDLSIDLLIIPNSIDTGTDVAKSDWHDKLYRRAPCRTMFLHDDTVREKVELQIAVIVNATEDDRSALRLGERLARSVGGKATAILFEPALDEVAAQVGQRVLSRIVSADLGRKSSNVESEVILADSLVDGVRKLDPDRFDLILLGSRQRREIRQFANAVPGTETGDAPAVATVRSKVALTSRVVSRLQNIVQRYVPQLTREQRVVLFEGIQGSSQWDFDFIALICLSTIIAALGLIDDSIPVVIGAMLVAPLMTPIVAIGLGLAQSNSRLVLGSLRTVGRGFVTAFLIGVLLGVFAFIVFSSGGITEQMKSRNLPGFLDLLVALFSGVAAAYALARPNLISALPGVAIAAAIVPPLATSGLSVALWDWELTVGALLLFLTNMVAIVLGAGVTFWLVGVREEKIDNSGRHWHRWLMLAILLVTMVLTASLETYQHPQWLRWLSGKQ